MWLPGRVEDVRFVVVGRRGSEEKEEGVNGEKDLSDHDDDTDDGDDDYDDGDVS